MSELSISYEEDLVEGLLHSYLVHCSVCSHPATREVAAVVDEDDVRFLRFCNKHNLKDLGHRVVPLERRLRKLPQVGVMQCFLARLSKQLG